MLLPTKLDAPKPPSPEPKRCRHPPLQVPPQPFAGSDGEGSFNSTSSALHHNHNYIMLFTQTVPVVIMTVVVWVSRMHHPFHHRPLIPNIKSITTNQ